MKHLHLILVFFVFQLGYSQYDPVMDLLYKRKFDKVEELISTNFEGNDQQLLKARLAYDKEELAEVFQILFNIDTLQLNNYQKGFYYDFLARTYDSNAERDEALKYFNIAKKYYKSEKLLSYYNQINRDIYYLYLSQEPFAEYAPAVLEEFEEIAKEIDNERQLIEVAIEKGFNKILEQDVEGFETAFEEGFAIAEKAQDSMGMGKLHSYKGLVYGEHLLNMEKADFHYDMAIKIYDAIDKNYKKKALLLNKSLLYEHQGDNKKSITYLLKAEKQPSTDSENDLNQFIYTNLADLYEKEGKTDSALVYSKKLIAINEKINENQQYINITRFEAEKKENENILLQQKNERSQNLLILLGISLFLLVLFTYLIYSNSKRKQLLLSKKRELAEQRNQSLLKEQELKSIDAMLEGQEKERQRMASDLHDNIGASLTSIKMHFNQIKQQINDKQANSEIFKKTDLLLEDTYQEIRNLAHLKNAGVLARDGLIPALENLVEKSSIHTDFKIELNVHDLDNRLKNNLEIGIFRIIQELIANIMKHAKATQVGISITNHGDLINIIVEDNGKGFDVENIEKKGMGLDSIKKKVAHFNGEIDIDSQKGIGTTVIIDIPV